MAAPSRRPLYGIALFNSLNSVTNLSTLVESRLAKNSSCPTPVFVDTPTLTDELDAAAEAVRGWLESGAVPDTIAILVHDRFQRDRVVNGLGERGVQVRAVDRERPQGGRPVVMTMHRAKGTEFSKVLLAGVGAPTPLEESRLAEMDDTERADAELRARSLVYVAATRARDELVVLRRT